MIIDGKKIAEDIFREIANQITHMPHAPHMTVFTCTPNFETQKYLALKKRKAFEVGIGVNIIELPQTLSTEEIIQSVKRACMQTDGIIVQLPLPAHIDTDAVLASIPKEYDIDGMHYDGTMDTFISPVVGAIAEITERHDILFAAQNVVVVGNGKLVGVPAALWAKKQGARVKVLDKKSKDSAAAIAAADILILGAGVPDLIKPDMIKEGVIIFDAGTSEDGGELTGDAHVDCQEKASFMTLVPGGIGPITVAVLLRNVMESVVRS